MVDNGVTIFFQGHDHIFARQELDGVIYQTLPEPANPYYTYENDDAYKSGDKYPNSGHVRVTVAPEQVTVDYIRSFLPADEKEGQVNGEVAFSYTVAAGNKPSSTATSNVKLPRFSAAATPTSTQPSVATFPGNIVLGRPTDRSVTASLLTDVEMDAYLEYGAVQGAYTGKTTPARLPAGQPVEVMMAGLQPNTPYFYRVRFHAPIESVFAADAERTFYTQRPPGSAFTFTLDADPHYRDPNFNAEVYSVTLRSALADKPDFHIDLGDTFMTEKIAPTSYEQVAATYREMRPFYGLLEGSAPLFLVNGNHDGELGWRLDGTTDKQSSPAGNLPVWATQARQTFYPNPAPDKFYSGSSTVEPLIGVRDGYYAWTWGDALFVVLDPYWYSTEKPRAADGADNWDLTLGEAQYQWLKQTLETSDARFKFIFAHNLVGGMDQNMRGGIEAAEPSLSGSACAVLLFGACTAMPSDGQGVRVDLPATAALSASATAIATEVPTIPTPSVGAKAPKAGKGGKGAQPTASVGEVPTVAAPAAKPGKAGRSAKPTVGPREAGPFLAPEVLGRPTDRSVTANLLPAEDLEVYFEYGAAPGAYTGRTPAATLPGDQPAEVTLDGLQPDTRTYYRIRYRLPGASEFAAGEEHSFATQRAPGSTFTFDIQGDSHPERVNKQFDPDLYERTLRSAAADRPDFYMTIGDDFSVDNLRTVNADTVTQLYANQRQWLGLVEAPVFLVNGNHEQASLANLDGTPDNVAVWAQNARNAYYPQPAPEAEPGSTGFYTGDAEPVEFIGATARLFCLDVG